MNKTITLALLCIGIAGGQTPPQKVEDENVRASLAPAAPGKKGPMHRHPLNRVLIHLDAGHQHQIFEDGRTRDNIFKPGDVSWDPADGMHTSENVGTAPYRMAEIEVKKPGGAPVRYSDLDPVKVDPKHYKVEFENSQVRVTRVRFGPRERGSMHEHLLPRLTVTLTDQVSRLTLPDGSVQEVRNAAGQMLLGGAAKHSEENLNDSPFEAIMVEFKGR
jgi:quercetin dioxygenase-like cupin family protein